MIKIIFLSIILFSGSLVGTINVDVFAQQNNANENSNGKANANELIEKAQTKGQIRIIVGLDESFTPEGYFGNAQEKMIQRANIRSAQGALLSELPFSEDTKSYKYKYIPFMAMTVNQNVLQHLIDSPMVTSIHEDVLEYTTLFESRGIIDVPEAYTLGGVGYTGAGQAVAILDSGVLSSHPFFSGRVVDQACFTNNNASSGVGSCPNGQSEQFGAPAGEPCAPNDAADQAKSGCYHGTHVAGIAAGDGTGIMGAPASGVAKDAKIMAIQVFTTFTAGCMGGPPCIGSFPSDQIKGMEHVLDKHNDPSFTHKIASINMSIGGSTTFSSDCDMVEPARLAAINNLRSVNIATVISSGNGSNPDEISAPGCISTAVTVGSTTNSDGIASYSNSADFLDLLAPGGSATDPCSTSIEATRIVSSFSMSTNHSCITQTTPPFGAIQGTSMAAPHVTGAWAVLKEKNPAATVDDLLSALQNNGVTITDTRPNPDRDTTRIDLDDALISITFCGSDVSTFNRIDGTAGNDVIGGTSGNDLIFAGAGDDHVKGNGGDDCIFGEGGNDNISGGLGNDEISGGVGVDNINGRAGDDTINGDAGDDILGGGSGNDTIQGGAGNDHIQGNAGIDILSGNDGDDVISGGTENDTINGNAGNDQLTGREGVDTIDGGTETDSCSGGGQGDTVTNCE